MWTLPWLSEHPDLWKLEAPEVDQKLFITAHVTLSLSSLSGVTGDFLLLGGPPHQCCCHKGVYIEL